MRQLFPTILIPAMLLLSACSHRPDYERISTYQDHAIPELNIAISDSARVLVVVPHADDETVAGGLITFFNEQGASIHLLTLCAHNDTRTEELTCSSEKLGIEKVEISGFVNNSWDAVMKDSMAFWYDHKDSIKSVVDRKIRSFKPNFMITYDAEIGGYGHPEHRISAEVTEELFHESKRAAGFAPDKIFQITLSRELEKFLVAKSPGYELAKSRTGSEGLPGPDVSVNIEKYWATKNAAGQCHQSQIRTLKRFFIVYDEEDKDEHVKTFSKEYYHVIQ